MANVISTATYRTLAVDWCNIKNNLLGLGAYFYAAANTIAILPDLVPTADLFASYYSTYNLNVANYNSSTPLLASIRALNSHVLSRSGYASIDLFLESTSTTIPQTWANLCLETGITISPSNILG